VDGAVAAGAWGLLGGSALLVGALVGVLTPVPRRAVGWVMAFGSGVLIASVSFELIAGARAEAGLPVTGAGVAAGALVFFGADLAVSRRGGQHRKRSTGERGEGSALVLTIGALLDGIPESVAIGASLLGGGEVSVAVVVAVFLSNVPEGLSSAVGLRGAGRSRGVILALWAAVAIVSGLAALLGYVLLDGAPPAIVAGLDSFAAGAILTMLASTMLPEAHEEGGAVTGLLTTAGFLVATALSAGA